MSAWYRTGTVTATNGSGTVTGNLTAWLANAKVGDAFTFDADSKVYEITAVGSNTGITISPVYAGSTGSGKAYGINRTSTAWNSASELSVQIAQFISTFDPLGLSQLSDPNADRIPFWDESSGAAGAMGWLTLSGLGISGTQMSVDTDIMSTARWPNSASVVSATTTDVFGQTSPYVTVTGSTGPITSLGNLPNRLRFVRFTGTPTITHNGTTLILPNAANLTVLSGSVHVFITDASGNVRWLWSNELATLTTAAGRALLDDATAAAQRTTLGVGTGDSPQFTAVNIGNASDTTVSRSAAGVLACEGSVMYQRNNIYGTVSQSSTVPTGAIIEYGSNAQGEYVRFADGTQDCWLSYSAGVAPSTAHGNIFITTNITPGNYPAAFSAAPVLLGFGRNPSVNCWAITGGAVSSTSWGGWRVASAITSADTGSTLYLRAIGRWY